MERTESLHTVACKGKSSKPAHYREVAITDKTGGCNNEAGVVERMFAQAPERVTQVNREETGGAVPHYKTNQLVGMRKGSAFVRDVAVKGLCAVLMVCGTAVRRYMIREILLSSRQAKGTWCVV